MKILHIINNLGSGGAEKLIEEMIPLMNHGDTTVEVLLLTDKNNVFQASLVDKGINITVSKYNSAHDIRNIIEIRRHILKGKYDIVHVHLFPSLYWASFAGALLGKKKPKLIYTEHSTHNRRRERKIYRPLEKIVYSQYDAVISISPKTRENLIEWLKPSKKDKERYFVIENGIDVKKIEEALPYKKTDLIQGMTEDTKCVCMVGRFSEAKDQHTLIRSIALLPEDVHLILVGEGPLLNKNIELAKELGIEARVHFLGFRKDVPRILKTVDIVVLSSHWEGFGLAAVEGMAAEKPVVASNVDGLKEIVNKAGLLFEKGNERELCNIIESLCADEKDYQNLIDESKWKIKLYNIGNTTLKYKELYKSILL